MTDNAQSTGESKNDVDWEAVYWQVTPRLYNYFRYRVGTTTADGGDDQTAQDLTAQVMLRAWRYRDGYSRDLGAFEGWLFGIARNVISDHLRGKMTRDALETDLPLDAIHALEADFSVEAEVQKRHDAEHLAALLATLPERDRELIALKYGAGLTNRAIADVMSLSESNVGTLLHRIVNRLRAAWETSYERES